MPTIYSKNKTTGEFERVGLGAINIPTKTSDLTNDSEFVNEGFVNDAINKIPTPDVSGQIDAHNTSEDAHEDIRNAIPTKTSELTNDSGFITGYTETDPTVPAWAKAASKPTYTASEVGADPSGSASAVQGNLDALQIEVTDIDARLTALEESAITVYSGTAAPLDTVGEEGDIYLYTGE